MKCMLTKRFLLASTLIISLLFSIGCSDPKLGSKWRDREIVIDGIDSEWEDCRLYYDADTRTTIGIYNDYESLYLNLSTGDRTLQRQIIGQGLYTWFNPRGNTGKKVGILFPTGMMGKYIPPQSNSTDRKDIVERPGGHRRTGEDAKRPWEGGQMSSPDIEIHIPDKDYENNILLDEIGGFGFEAQYRHHADRLVYELRIPLVENDMMADVTVGAKSGRIGIGFVTKKIDRKDMWRGSDGNDGRKGPGGPGRHGGKGGAGGGMGGPGGKGGGMGGHGGKKGGFSGADRKGMKDMLKVHELWIKVELASGP